MYSTHKDTGEKKKKKEKQGEVRVKPCFLKWTTWLITLNKSFS